MADKPGGGSSATQDKPSPATQAKQSKTDDSLKSERGKDSERYGGDEPLPYPEFEPADTVTFRDPRPLDNPQKADRSVFIGMVHRAEADDDDDEPSGDYVYANQLTDDPKDEGEIELGGEQVKDAQVVAGGGRLVIIANGTALDFSALGAALYGELGQALQMNANS